MKKHSRFLLPTLALALTGALFSPHAVLAQGGAKPAAAPATAAATTANLGVIDEEKLSAGYKGFRTAIENFTARATSLQKAMPARELLSADEAKEFDALIIKTSFTPAEKTRFDAIVASGMGKRDEFTSLAGNSTRTDAQKTRLKALQDLMAANQSPKRNIEDVVFGVVDQMGNSVQPGIVDKQLNDLNKQYNDNVDSVVAQLAAEKKMTAIISKRFLYWSTGSIDITDEVLKRLNQ